MHACMFKYGILRMRFNHCSLSWRFSLDCQKNTAEKRSRNHSCSESQTRSWATISSKWWTAGSIHTGKSIHVGSRNGLTAGTKSSALCKALLAQAWFPKCLAKESFISFRVAKRTRIEWCEENGDDMIGGRSSLLMKPRFNCGVGR